ncbi:hypothetical protein AMAG_13167 [Allomyces macrogynus ATCC 38327]|uniref:Uncharacterized protein n=1 Tax=Allomyces macrogynus (strain ATCC 38327) TaxID=578462 RepID=A0A0L0SZS1_ALLM3|nr:hypothetical protein AMAG_13167 [Allomyces macrogynus ATCC 38327]|eukprot:KNE67992.1 hypothetical protein AMAG_13167 [Allomyces macrogynus ATCC 38327]
MSDAAMSTAAAATGSAGHVSTMAAVGLAVAAGAAALYSIIALEKPLRPQPPMARRRRGGRAGVRAMRREHKERQRQQQQELDDKQQQQVDDDDARRLPSPAPSDIAEPDDVAVAAAVNRARTPSPVSATPAAPVHLSQLDADSLDSELAKTDAKLRRLLVRKERLELRRTQLSVTAMHRPPSTGPAAAATDIIDHADVDPAVNDEDIAWGHAPVSLATTTASPLSPSPTDTTGTSLTSPRPYESVPRRARRVSHTSSTDSANGSALSTSPTATAPAVFPSHSSDSSESGGNEVDAMAQLQQDMEDDRDDVLSALSDDSDLASSFISDLSLGSDFSLLSEARYGRPAA